MAQVALYVRTSTTQQESSIEAQKERLNSWCKRHKVEGRFFTDRLSGKTDKRKSLKQMFTYAKQGKVNQVVVCKADRLSRNTLVGLRLKKQLEKIGCKLTVLDIPVDLVSAYGHMMFTQLLAFSEFELAARRERVDAVLWLKTPPKELIKLRGLGWSQTKLAKHFGIAPNTIRKRLRALNLS